MKADIHTLRFLSRTIRAGALRAFLRVTLWICFLEDRLHPPESDGRKRVLMLVFGGLGDCLLFDVLFRRMKEQWPGVRIDVLTGSFESMWQRLDSIDHLMFFGRNTVKSPLSYFSLFRRIYRNRYSLAVEGLAMLPKRGVWSVLTSLMLQASRAPVRVGRPTTGRVAYLPETVSEFMDRKGMEDRKRNPRVAPHSSCNRLVSPPPPDKRSCHEALHVAQAIGVEFFRKPDEPRLSAKESQTLWARNLLRDRRFGDGDVVVGLIAETTYPLKRWPTERFHEIVERGIEDGMKFVVLGHGKPDPRMDSRHPDDCFVDISGATTLDQMIAVIQECDLFLSADTGPAHVAQACGIPTIAIFGPSNDREFGPADLEKHTLITPADQLPCRPCVLGPCVRGQSCMHLISVDTVYASLKKKFAEVLALRQTRIRTGPSRDHRRGPDTRRGPTVLLAI
jgi:ADP-heptose:LPS heptosyltransferase